MLAFEKEEKDGSNSLQVIGNERELQPKESCW